MRKLRILLAGGGTGGHVFPLVEVARELLKRGVEVAFIGPEEFPLDVLREEGIQIKTITPAGKLRRYWSFETIRDFLKLPIALWESFRFVRFFKPDVVLGKGGYGSIGPVLAARLLKIPIVLHESDVAPGLANRFLAPFADTVAVSFTETKKYFPTKNAVLTGNPIRLKFFSLTKNEARRVLGLETKRQIIFVLGGSQGAASLNQLIKKALPQLARRYGVIISTGKNNAISFKDTENKKHIIIKSLLNEKEVAAAYILADAVLTRAGAGSIFEVAAFAKPAILVPLGLAAGGHQLKNARAYEETGAAVVLNEENADEHILALTIESILQNQTTKDYMSSRARLFAKPQAALKLAQILINTASNRRWGKIVK